jgi:site-specific DNA-cytosine methylase
MKVLSLFDGKSCLQIALEKAGINVTEYYASEIDKYAIQITQKNFPNTRQLGSVTNLGIAKPFLDTWIYKKDTGEKLFNLHEGIDLLAGGSPCQNLSPAVINNIKHNKGLEGDKSSLFYEYLRILTETKPKYFLLENVGGMKDKDKDIISEALGVQPIRINSNKFSAQDRDRYYWTNIPVPEQENYPNEYAILLDIVVPSNKVPKKYWYDVPFTYNGDYPKVQATLDIKGHDILKRVYNLNNKCGTLTKVSGGSQQKKVYQDGRCRKLMPIEYERLQNVPDNYTEGVSDSQRYNMLGNGWTVDVITHILKQIELNIK